MEGIRVYKGNSKTIQVNLPSGFVSGSTYTANFTVTDKEMTGTTFITKTSLTCTNTTCTITLTKAETTIPERVYFYEVDLIKGTEKITIIADTFSVLPAIL